jgi:hypothetical protein
MRCPRVYPATAVVCGALGAAGSRHAFSVPLRLSVPERGLRPRRLRCCAYDIRVVPPLSRVSGRCFHGVLGCLQMFLVGAFSRPSASVGKELNDNRTWNRGWRQDRSRAVERKSGQGSTKVVGLGMRSQGCRDGHVREGGVVGGIRFVVDTKDFGL